jgi:hypothetical protein
MVGLTTTKRVMSHASPQPLLINVGDRCFGTLRDYTIHS